jgi:hypothetical protein
MKSMHCPDCGSQRFYIKDPDDPFTLFEFDIQDGKIIADDENNDSAMPAVTESTETYCDRCAWHGRFKNLSG